MRLGDRIAFSHVNLPRKSDGLERCRVMLQNIELRRFAQTAQFKAVVISGPSSSHGKILL